MTEAKAAHTAGTIITRERIEEIERKYRGGSGPFKIVPADYFHLLEAASLGVAAPQMLKALEMLSVRIIEGDEGTLLLFAGRAGIAKIKANSIEGVALLKFSRAQEAAIAAAKGGPQ